MNVKILLFIENAVEKGLQYQYRDRKNRKRVFVDYKLLKINIPAR